jgi:ribose transport system permease protein
MSPRAAIVPRLRAELAGKGYAAPAVVLFVILLAVAGLRSHDLFTSHGLTVAFSVAAPLVLATMALTPPVISGRGGIDLSVGPLMSFINVTIVSWLVAHGTTSPVLVIGYALGISVAAGLLKGILVAYVRLQPIVVTLAGYLILTGLALYVLPVPGGEVPDWLAGLAKDTGGFPTAALVLLGVVIVWTAISRTTLFRNIRLVGGDERACFASGVPIRGAQIAAYVLGSLFAGAAGLMLTAVIASGDPTQGTQYTLTSIAALALGGVSLAGGRGGILGAVFGAFDVFLVNYVLGTFDFGVNAPYVSQLSYGVVLVLALAIAAGVGALTILRRRGGEEVPA